MGKWLNGKALVAESRYTVGGKEDRTSEGRVYREVSVKGRMDSIFRVACRRSSLNVLQVQILSSPLLQPNKTNAGLLIQNRLSPDEKNEKHR